MKKRLRFSSYSDKEVDTIRRGVARQQLLMVKLSLKGWEKWNKKQRDYKLWLLESIVKTRLKYYEL